MSERGRPPTISLALVKPWLDNAIARLAPQAGGHPNLRAFAKLAGVSHQTVYRWGLGKGEGAQHLVLRAASKLGIDPPPGVAIPTTHRPITTPSLSARAQRPLSSSGDPRVRTGDPSVTPRRDTVGIDGEGVAAMIARQVARVIEECIQLDEAEQTRDGRAALADALEAFADRFDNRRLNAEAVLAIYKTAARLRRGEM